MPDISMCMNKECKKRKKCYRFMAIPCEYQSYATFKCKKSTINCDHFMEILKTDKLRKLKD